MLNNNAKKLVAALRSGEYEQTTQKLSDGEHYCCLGVACELYLKEHPNFLTKETIDDLVFYNGGHEILPTIVKQWLNFQSTNGQYGNCSLATLNDNGMHFSEIANVIESEPQGLFCTQEIEQ